MNFPSWIIVHHTAVSYKKNPNQYTATDMYHKQKGWGGIGYHYLIEMDGTLRIGRTESSIGAHTSQKLMNFRSIGICLTGDFDNEDPTLAQCVTLLGLLKDIMQRRNISPDKVVPHRHYAPKSCWGNRLPDDILTYLENRVTKKTRPAWELNAIKWARDEKIVEDWSSPDEMVGTKTASIMLHRAKLISEEKDLIRKVDLAEIIRKIKQK